MRRIAIAAAKGGTGKTTTAVSLAHALALAGRRVLLVDCDPKRHAALHFGLPADGGLAALLHGRSAQAVEVRQGLRLVDSGGRALAALEMQLGREAGGMDALRRLVEARFAADYVLFDCPPWLGPLHVGVLLASDALVLPVGSDFLSLASARQTLDVVRELAERGSRRPRLLGILPTFYDPAAASAEQVEAVLRESYAGQVLQTRVHCSEALRLAPAQRGTVFESEPLSRAALDYALLAEEIEDLAA
jgi:chromosome partitioning protein